VTTVSRYPSYLFPSELEELRNQVRLLELVPGVKQGLLMVNSFGQKFPKVKNLLKRMLQRFHFS
jgi:hypothetical protein